MVTPYNESGVPQTPTITSYFFGGAYEVTGSDVRKYYSFGGQTILKDSTGLQYFLTDHLGSTVAITNASGTLTSQQRYLPFGGVRTNIGPITQTDLGYTGQRDDSYIKLMDYDFRWYGPELGRFISPDSIVPNLANPQSLNRYAYVLNNPIRYNDPTGHKECDYKCQIEFLGADPAYEHYCETCEWDVGEQRKNTKIAETILYDGTELVTSILFEPADWALTANDCLNGNCSLLALAFMAIPGLSGKYGTYVDDAISAFWRKEFAKYPNAPYAVLGYVEDAYDKIARGLDATFLYSKRYDEYKNLYGRQAFWDNINAPFIQNEIINKGKDVFLATPLGIILKNSKRFAYDEVQMLLDAGYLPKGGWLIAPPKP